MHALELKEHTQRSMINPRVQITQLVRVARDCVNNLRENCYTHTLGRKERFIFMNEERNNREYYY